jgi:hypothetical protein
LQALGHGFGIAMLAACAHLVAAGAWVPGGFGPFYFGVLHTLPPQIYMILLLLQLFVCFLWAETLLNDLPCSLQPARPYTGKVLVCGRREAAAQMG